jgi:hypothetical protein
MVIPVGTKEIYLTFDGGMKGVLKHEVISPVEYNRTNDYINIELGKVLLHAIRCRDLSAFSYWMGMSTGLAGCFIPAKDYARYQEAWAREVGFKYPNKQ